MNSFSLHQLPSLISSLYYTKHLLTETKNSSETIVQEEGSEATAAYFIELNLSEN